MVRSLFVGVSASVLASVAGLALAQGDAPEAKGTTAPAAKAPENTAPSIRPSGNASRDTLMRMQRVVNIELNETRLEDVMKFIIEQTGIETEVFWKTDSGDGLDKEMLITLSIKSLTALEMLDKVLEKAADGSVENSWQMTPRGVMQIGPKSRLNKFKRVEIYDINDLLLIVPTHDNAPQVDLDKVLQSSGRGGGGSGGSPFTNLDSGQRRREEEDYKARRAKAIVDIIQQLVEHDQWIDGGGDGGTITYQDAFPGQIIVNAADYMHRGLGGYRWWPATRTGNEGGRSKRYVSLNLDTSNSGVDLPIRTLPVSATVGGGR